MNNLKPTDLILLLLLMIGQIYPCSTNVNLAKIFSSNMAIHPTKKLPAI